MPCRCRERRTKRKENKQNDWSQTACLWQQCKQEFSSARPNSLPNFLFFVASRSFFTLDNPFFFYFPLGLPQPLREHLPHSTCEYARCILPLLFFHRTPPLSPRQQQELREKGTSCSFVLLCNRKPPEEQKTQTKQQPKKKKKRNTKQAEQ